MNVYKCGCTYVCMCVCEYANGNLWTLHTYICARMYAYLPLHVSRDSPIVLHDTCTEPILIRVKWLSKTADWNRNRFPNRPLPCFLCLLHDAKPSIQQIWILMSRAVHVWNAISISRNNGKKMWRNDVHFSSHSSLSFFFHLSLLFLTMPLRKKVRSGHNHF